MQKNKMLRLFGVAETDTGEIYISNHGARGGDWRPVGQRARRRVDI